MLNKKIYKALWIYLLLSFCFSSILNAQVLIKLATITPDNSPWNDTLYAGAERVEKLTNGRVRIRIYGNGLAGGEREVLRKIRLGSVEAGVFSALALKSLVPGTLVMTLPYFVRTEKQLQRVLDELTPEFNSTFATKGYEVLGWAFSGWIHMFYKNDIRSPEQVGNVRLGVDPSEAELRAAWQSLGFRVTPVSLSGTFIALQNGLVTGFYSTPIGALAYQWFAFTPYMIRSKVAPLLGAVLISGRTWRRISPPDQVILRKEMNQMLQEFSSLAQEKDLQALEVMKKNGLKISSSSKAEEQAWEAAFIEKGYPVIIGKDRAISNELYKRARQLIQKP